MTPGSTTHMKKEEVWGQEYITVEESENTEMSMKIRRKEIK